jgi:hypothetical protein
MRQWQTCYHRSHRFGPSDMLIRLFRTIVFFSLMTPAFASQTLDALIDAATVFSATIQQQLEEVKSDPSAANLAEKTIEYAKAKTAYYRALRTAMPELINIATGKEASPPELNKFAAAFAIAGEKQEMGSDQKTRVFLKRFSPNPDVEKARAEFERAQNIEERFHKDFDGVDFTER